MADETVKKTELCSKCADNQVTGEGNPRWCTGCKTNYNREYRALKEGRAEKKGFAAGVTAMRESLAAEFDRAGSIGHYQGREVAALIREAPAPLLD